MYTEEYTNMYGKKFLASKEFVAEKAIEIAQDHDPEFIKEVAEWASKSEDLRKQYKEIAVNGFVPLPCLDVYIADYLYPCHVNPENFDAFKKLVKDYLKEAYEKGEY